MLKYQKKDVYIYIYIYIYMYIYIYIYIFDTSGTCNTNNQIKFDFSNAYLIVKGIIAVAWQEADAAAIAADRNDKQAIIKNCAPFTDCISGINNTQVDNAKNLDVVMLVYDLIEYNNN